MILRQITTCLLLSLLGLTPFPSTVLAKKSSPTITTTKFASELTNIFYFDDSNVILAHDEDALTIYRSTDAGASWSPISKLGEDGQSFSVYPHPFDNMRAYILGPPLTTTHWMTADRGATWKEFNSQVPPRFGAGGPMSFHGRNPRRVIWNGEDCFETGLFEWCTPIAYYTLDDFETVELLTEGGKGGCSWAVSTEIFGEEIAPEIEDRVFCIRNGRTGSFGGADRRLTVSDRFFADGDGLEPALDNGRAVSGIISMASVKKFILAAAKSKGTDELSLYVTKDATTWHRAEFGQHRIAEDAYTVLEGTNYSMQVDVLGSRRLNPTGYLFTSNSNGTYFRRTIDHTNRNIWGTVDFEQVSGINGVYLVNTVSNAEKVDGPGSVDKDIVSKITFDDGRTFQQLSVGEDALQLHSVSDSMSSGRIFSSPAPGIVMGIGNTGKLLKAWERGDLYVSDDAGVNWSKAQDGSHLYEFGNQGAVLVAVEKGQGKYTDKIKYSLDHGKTWTKADLDQAVMPEFLTTVPDSTTLSFLIGGWHSEDGEDNEFHISKIDFEGLHERTCGKKDFEDNWPARVDDKGKPSCIMGQKQFYRRRKADADCVVEGEFADPVPKYESCECTIDDFECDFNFERSEDRLRCLPVEPLPVPEGACKTDKDTFRSPSGWRKIPGNGCKGGKDLVEEIVRPCSDNVAPPTTGDEIMVEKTNFNAQRFREIVYMERGSNIRGHGNLHSDETLVMLDDAGDCMITHDHGKTWIPILEGKTITSMVQNPYYKDYMFFMTGTERVHYTIDRGITFSSFDAPKPPSDNGLAIMRFHPDFKDWILWSGLDKRGGKTNVYITLDRGDGWQTMIRGVRRCDFINRSYLEKDKLILCEQFADEDPSTKQLRLLSSDNFFANNKEHYSDVLDFATMAEFIIVAQKTEDKKGLKVVASINGEDYAAAEWPRNFQVESEQAYTVMDSSTHAVFLHVTVNPYDGKEYGSIVKSNSNGTEYVKLLDNVNRDTPGYVDFEKMQGIEGLAMVNVVVNPSPPGEDQGNKILQSRISHNDGSDWAFLSPPAKDISGKSYPCVKSDKPTDDCALHVHSYTERIDKAATFSSPTAIGLMIAVGNVGNSLKSRSEGSSDTFLTNDAGLSWTNIASGPHLYEFGDSGSIIVLVPDSIPTRDLKYSLDEGETWVSYKFSPDVDMEINLITTLPSDTSMNFLLWGREVGSGSSTGKISSVNVDFSNLPARKRMCQITEADPVAQDYYLWSPSHPFQKDSQCLFGHVAQYHRKKTDAQCRNGPALEDGPHTILRNCSCTRQDFECDFNYQRQVDGSCVLVEGFSPPDHSEICKLEPGREEYYAPTGYRRIPLSTCQGGAEYDVAQPMPCPGYEKEFAQRHGLSGLAIFFIVIVSICGAAGIGYWAKGEMERRGMLTGLGFGPVRLGESLSNVAGGRAPSASAGSKVADIMLQSGVVVVAGVVAVAKALPLLVSSLFRSAKGYVPVSGGGSGSGRFGGLSVSADGPAPYRNRDSFANRRTDVAAGDADEFEDDELLGDGEGDEEEV